MAPLVADPRLELLVLQPTPFCNLDCDYCYLPHRDSTRRISRELIRRTFEQVLASPLARHGFTVIWHAGEPMVLPVAFYEEAFDLIDSLNVAGLPVDHSFQTNGTLITEDWCRLIRERCVRVGVSVDGPDFLHDARRKTRTGKGTHERVMQGIRTLQEHDVDFHVITVLTFETLEHADELFEFYCANGIHRVGFNIEEIEGINIRSSLNARMAERRVRRFLARFLDLVHTSRAPLEMREFDGLRRFIMSGRSYLNRNQENTPLAIVSIDVEGRVSTFSPELLGIKSERYGDFVIGNILQQDLADLIASPELHRMTADVESGIERCRSACDYFGVCGGGAPSNKYFENGTFDCTETMHCRLQKQAFVDTMLDMEEHIR